MMAGIPSIRGAGREGGLPKQYLPALTPPTNPPLTGSVPPRPPVKGLETNTRHGGCARPHQHHNHAGQCSPGGASPGAASPSAMKRYRPTEAWKRRLGQLGLRGGRRGGGAQAGLGGGGVGGMRTGLCGGRAEGGVTWALECAAGGEARGGWGAGHWQAGGGVCLAGRPAPRHSPAPAAMPARATAPDQLLPALPRPPPTTCTPSNTVPSPQTAAYACLLLPGPSPRDSTRRRGDMGAGMCCGGWASVYGCMHGCMSAWGQAIGR